MNKETIIIGSIIGIIILSGAFLSLPSVSADDSVVDQINITVPSSCTMSGTGMNTHNAEINNGTYTPDIGTTTLHAFCNDTEGFAIYAVGYTDNEFGKTVLTNSTLGNTYDIATGTAESGDNSNWAMKLAISQDSGDTTGTNALTIDNSFGSYHAVPNEYTKVAHKNTITDMTESTGGVKLTTTYASFISKTQPAGTYTGQVKYTLVHPASETPLQPQQATAGCINYFPNGSNVIGTMGCQSATDGSSKTLLASNFSRTGYGFAGWSDAYDYATNPNAHFYGPSETITAPVGTTANGLSLYAVWIKSQGSIQDISKVASICSSLTTAPTDGTANLSSVSALTDQRDNETYAIAKLADGNCWTIENLRLESNAEHNSDGALAQGYGGQFAGLANAEPAWANNITTANSLYSTDGVDGTINIGAYSAQRFPRYNNYNTPSESANRPQNPTTNSATNSASNASLYGYGNYYSWAASIADTTEYIYNNTSITNTSICPSGWRLPQGGDKTRIESDDDNDFWNLTVDALNGGTLPANYSSSTTPYYNGSAEAVPVANKLRSFPNNFVYSGDVSSGLVRGCGSVGYYWSSTALSYDNVYKLDIGSSNVYPGTSGFVNKYYGMPIRCLTPGL